MIFRHVSDVDIIIYTVESSFVRSGSGVPRDEGVWETSISERLALLLSRMVFYGIKLWNIYHFTPH